MKNFIQRTKDAAACYLERNDYEIIERDWKAPADDGGFDIIAMNSGTLVFVKTAGRDGKREGFDFAKAAFERETDESHALQYLALHDEEFVDCPIRFDTVSITSVSESHAMIRHQTNCMSTYDLKEE